MNMAVYEIYQTIEEGSVKFHVKDARPTLTLEDYFMSGPLDKVIKHLKEVRELSPSDEFRTIPVQTNYRGIEYFPVTMSELRGCAIDLSQI